MVIFSIISILIVIATESENLNNQNFIQYLGISILFGFLMSVFILSIAITSVFFKVKSLIKFYNLTPRVIKEKYGIQLYWKQQNTKYTYPEPEMIVTKTKIPFRIHVEENQLWIIIYNNLDTIENFHKKSLEIEKKYKKEKITLTGWGFKKIISKKKWVNFNENSIETLINQLKLISENENIKVLTLEKTGHNTG